MPEPTDSSTRSANAIRILHPDDVHLESLPYKFPMRNSVTLDAEIRQIEACVARGYEQLRLQPLRDDWVSVVGYGPSLHETWREIKNPCMTVSGAHDFLVQHGIIPDWHAECDGRDHKTKHLEKPHPGVTYVMATICNPRMWELLDGCRILRWHNANGQHVVKWIAEHDDGSILVAGGSNIGLSAIHLCGILGFRKFRLFGFDGNIREEGGKWFRHAGEHYGPKQKAIRRGKWLTTPQMSNAVDEFGWLKRDNPGLQFEIFGESLMKDVHGNGVLR